ETGRNGPATRLSCGMQELTGTMTSRSERTSVQDGRKMPIAVGGCLIALLTFGLAAHVSPLGALMVIATFLAMAYAGVVCLSRALPSEQSKLSLLVFGAVLGLMLGRVGLIVTGLIGAIHTAGLLLVSVAWL